MLNVCFKSMQLHSTAIPEFKTKPDQTMMPILLLHYPKLTINIIAVLVVSVDKKGTAIFLVRLV